jgi:hypothetical protein
MTDVDDGRMRAQTRKFAHRPEPMSSVPRESGRLTTIVTRFLAMLRRLPNCPRQGGGMRVAVTFVPPAKTSPPADQ